MAAGSMSVSGQVAAFERQARAFVKRVLLATGRTVRARMNAERLSGPPGLNKITGKLMRSQRYALIETPRGYKLEYSIGGGAAHYAGEHEERGRLQFQATFDKVAGPALEEIRIGLDVLARLGPGRASAVIPEVPMRAAVVEEIGRLREKRAADKLKRQMNWRSMTREGRKPPGELSRKRIAARKSKAYRLRRDMNWRSIRRGF